MIQGRFIVGGKFHNEKRGITDKHSAAVTINYLFPYCNIRYDVLV